VAEQARILERGYRKYDGERGGVGASIRTATVHAIQRSLGLKRTVWQKVLPLVSIGMAYVPAIVFVGIAALSARFRIDQQELGPSYADYYGFVSAAILIFTAFVAPEVLCTDRRSGMLGLYLASPLDRTTYLLSKALAVLAVLSIVTTGPLLLWLIGLTILGSGPDGVDGWFLAFGRILLAGLTVSSIHVSLSLVVSSMTTRRAVASAAIVIVLFGSGAVTGSLIDAGRSPNLVAGNFFVLPIVLVYRIWGQSPDESTFTGVSTWLLAGACAGWTLLFSGITWWRYRTLTVTR
jgi:ABC-2 type transport system permease protein